MNRQIQQPATLRTLATSNILKWISLHATHVNRTNYKNIDAFKDDEEAEHFLTQTIETIRNYLENTPEILLNHLIQESKIYLANLQYAQDWKLSNWKKLKVVNRIMEVFFGKNVTVLNINRNESINFRQIFSSKSNLLTGLRTLKLVYEMPSRKEEDFYLDGGIDDMFRIIPNLKHLVLTFCDDSILFSIIKNFKLIETLDLYDYYPVSIKKLKKLTRMPNLKTVNLYETTIRYFMDEDVIKSNKRLILNYISSRKLFQVKSYVVYNDTTSEDLRLIVEKYPKIQIVGFAKTGGDFALKNDLKILEGLQELRTLEMRKYVLHDNIVKEVIKVIGRNIEVLRFNDVDVVDLKAIQYIGFMCPNLQELTLREVRRFNVSSSVKTNKRPGLKNLRKLYMIKPIPSLVDNRQIAFGHIILYYLLVNSPNIERIFCENFFNLNLIVFRVLDKNPMKHLKELRLFKQLEPLAVNRIIENGAKPLITYFFRNY